VLSKKYTAVPSAFTVALQTPNKQKSSKIDAQQTDI
jgi:hypothetical protein